MKVLFKIYNMTDGHPNYFDITDPDLGDTLILTKHCRFPEVTKELTSRMDFNQLHYGTIELEIGLLSKEKSIAGKSVTQFFDSFFNEQTSINKKMLVILDSGKTRSAWFVFYPSTFDFSYAKKSDGFKLTLMARDAVCEWKELAETIKPGYYNQPNTSFKDFIKNQLVTPHFYMFIQNDVDPFAIIGHSAILNHQLFTWCYYGNSDSFTVYNIFKGLAVEWGLVYRFEVPEDYEAQAIAGRVAFTFHLMRRVNGNAATMKPQDYYRTQLPRVEKPYILLVNRRCNISHSLNGDNVNADIVHGMFLTMDNAAYINDDYNMNVMGRHGFPTDCCIMSASSANDGSFNDYYKNKIIIRQANTDVFRVNANDVLVIENEMFSLNLNQAYSLKFGNSRVYYDQPLINRSNSRITATRLFVKSVEVNNENFGATDYMAVINNLPKNELKVYFKNTGSVKGRTGIMKYEPDLFDTFIVPYNGVNEVHSIIRIVPNYNINQGESSMTAEYQTVRIA